MHSDPDSPPKDYTKAAMNMFHLFRKKLPLSKQDIPLGKYIAGYELCSPLYVEDGDVLYLGATREVHCRVLIPDGPQGYRVIKVPATVKTVEALLRYLEKKPRLSPEKVIVLPVPSFTFSPCSLIIQVASKGCIQRKECYGL